MEKFMTAEEMRSFQRESLEMPSEEVSNLKGKDNVHS